MEKKKITLKQMVKLPKELKDRLVIYGVHPNDKRKPKMVYRFWCSSYLQEKYPCVGDMIMVSVKGKIEENGERKNHLSPLFITDIKKWKEGEVEPVSIAFNVYTGGKWSDFSYGEGENNEVSSSKS